MHYIVVNPIVAVTTAIEAAIRRDGCHVERSVVPLLGAIMRYTVIQHSYFYLFLFKDNYYEEAFKMRNVLEEFHKDHSGGRKPTILGLREHIFTGRSACNNIYLLNFT